ncbi:reverse transcriptase [Gossypium australe]|uniref:Reverse transcriptase n=1 Tax=Gossypium australe TaxID=47621 RepID=A0A5B6VUC8_9ROSI|nr:reverse transcriptase [Gossypium australe]
MKKVIIREPVLVLPNYLKLYEIHTNVSDYPIGVMQNGHLISFESLKLNETKQRYTFQEKEMATMKKLSPKQVRWQIFLTEFDFSMEYKLRSANTVADVFSQKIEFTVINQLDSSLLERIREGFPYDPTIKNLIELANDGKTR